MTQLNFYNTFSQLPEALYGYQTVLIDHYVALLRKKLGQKIEQAEAKDFTLVNELVAILAEAYDKHPSYGHLTELPKDSQKHLEISCSS